MKTYFTITGTNFRYGQDFLEKGMKVRLEKEPDNKYDKEAIKVVIKGLGQVGYVANSPRTVLGESFSAGRLYDKIGDKAKGRVFMVMDKGVLCWLDPEKNAPDKEKHLDEETEKEPFHYSAYELLHSIGASTDQLPSHPGEIAQSLYTGSHDHLSMD